MERRDFLATSLMTVTAFTGGTTADEARSATLRTPATGPIGVDFNEARFRGLLGSRFHFTGDDWRGHLVLTEVIGRTSDARVDQFMTVFRTTGDVRPAPGMYEVDHPDTGRFRLRIDGRRESDLRLAAFALLRG